MRHFRPQRETVADPYRLNPSRSSLRRELLVSGYTISPYPFYAHVQRKMQSLISARDQSYVLPPPGWNPIDISAPRLSHEVISTVFVALKPLQAIFPVVGRKRAAALDGSPPDDGRPPTVQERKAQVRSDSFYCTLLIRHN